MLRVTLVPEIGKTALWDLLSRAFREKLVELGKGTEYRPDFEYDPSEQLPPTPTGRRYNTRYG